MPKSNSPAGPAQSANLRLFIGLPCSANEVLREQLRALSELEAPGLRAVPETNLHVTLKFLGNTPATLVPRITEQLQHLRISAAFEVALRGAGFFHGALWLGVENDARLTALAQEVDAQMSQLGFAPERRPWRPHLTVARLSAQARFDARRWQHERQGRHWGTLPVGSVNLYQSKTLPGGARYDVLHTVTLVTR